MSNNPITTFSGMLNQHEFKERYVFIVQRIANGFSKEDIAFLLGRTPYHIIDYEELSNQIKFDYEDHEILAELFKTPVPSTPVFDNRVNKQDISIERRMIRGQYLEIKKTPYSKFIHPWNIKGINKPIIINTSNYRDPKSDDDIRHLLTHHLNMLINTGYFSHKSTSIMIYRHVYKSIRKEWRSLFLPLLKLVMYEFIRTNKLTTKNERGHIYYQTKL